MMERNSFRGVEVSEESGKSYRLLSTSRQSNIFRFC
jgi:hypothetical protein